MGKLNSKLSSWRSHSVTCTAQNTTTYFFMDTSPNMFYIQNTSDKSLYVGLSYMPTIERYEFEIKPHSQRAIGRPLPVKNIYFLNPSGEDIPIQIWSIEDVFDVSIFQDLSVDNITFDSDAMDKLAFDGVIRGINCALPGGINHLGSVNIDGLSGSAHTIWNNINNKVNDISSKLVNINTKINLIEERTISEDEWTYVFKVYTGSDENIFPNSTDVRMVEIFSYEPDVGSYIKVTNETGEVLPEVALWNGQKFKAKQMQFVKGTGEGIYVCLRYRTV